MDFYFFGNLTADVVSDMNPTKTKGKGVKRFFLWGEHLTLTEEGLNQGLTSDTRLSVLHIDLCEA